jgi:hypothetical protein
MVLIRKLHVRLLSRHVQLEIVRTNITVVDKTLSIVEEILTTNQSKVKHIMSVHQPEAQIDGYTMRWPQFGINNVFFNST